MFNYGSGSVENISDPDPGKSYVFNRATERALIYVINGSRLLICL